MWPSYLHHLSLHFPIVLTLALALVGVWSLRENAAPLHKLMRVGGWVCFAMTTVAAVSGIASAPGWFGGAGSEALSHHRSMGVTAWVVIALAAASYEWGVRRDISDWRNFAVGLWCVAAFAIIGTGHWGGSQLHPEEIPWHDAPADAPE